MSVNNALLEVESLGVHYGLAEVLDDVSFTIEAGETLGLVGESGSGKSTLARAILRLIPASRGAVRWQGVDLLACEPQAMREYRRDLQIVFQDPLASLNPRMSIGEILTEPLRIFESHLDSPTREARVAEMLERVGLASSMSRRYPHEFSGGQCQRVGIARAMMLRPKLLVCDEPVSSLDVSIQGQIVNLLSDLQREFGMAMLFISHNLAIVRHLSRRVLVIYLGRVVELATREVTFESPLHPYTRALLAAVPDPRRSRQGVLATAQGELPRGGEIPSGCSFRNRCAYAQPKCASSVPPLEEAGPGHAVACHRRRELVYS